MDFLKTLGHFIVPLFNFTTYKYSRLEMRSISFSTFYLNFIDFRYCVGRDCLHTGFSFFISDYVAVSNVMDVCTTDTVNEQ